MPKKFLVPLIGVAAALLVLVGAVAALAIKGDGDEGSEQGSGRGYLGVAVASTAAGLRVSSVESDGPAAKAGIQAGDVIRSVDGTVVRTPEQLRRAVEERSPGSRVEVTYDRGDSELRATVRLGEAPADAQAGLSPTPGPGQQGRGFLSPQADRGRLGAQAQEITPALKQRLNLTRDQGVVITGVTPGSPAATAGLQAGDIVLAVDDRQVTTVAELQQAVQAVTPGQEVSLKVLRGTEEKTLTASIGRGQVEDLPGLDQLPPQAREFLSRLLQSGAFPPEQLRQLFQDRAGRAIQVGTVKDVTDTGLTIAPFGAGQDVTIAIDDGTEFRRGNETVGAADLRSGETVLVVSRDGGKTAFAVFSLGRQQLPQPQPPSAPPTP